MSSGMLSRESRYFLKSFSHGFEASGEAEASAAASSDSESESSSMRSYATFPFFASFDRLLIAADASDEALSLFQRSANFKDKASVAISFGEVPPTHYGFRVTLDVGHQPGIPVFPKVFHLLIWIQDLRAKVRTLSKHTRDFLRMAKVKASLSALFS